MNFAILFALLESVRSFTAIVVEGTCDQGPHDICRSVGGIGVVANSTNIDILMKLLKEKNVEKAFVYGYEDHIGPMILYSNGTLVPYIKNRITSKFALCVGKCPCKPKVVGTEAEKSCCGQKREQPCCGQKVDEPCCGQQEVKALAHQKVEKSCCGQQEVRPCCGQQEVSAVAHQNVEMPCCTQNAEKPCCTQNVEKPCCEQIVEKPCCEQKNVCFKCQYTKEFPCEEYYAKANYDCMTCEGICLPKKFKSNEFYLQCEDNNKNYPCFSTTECYETVENVCHSPEPVITKIKKTKSRSYDYKFLEEGNFVIVEKDYEMTIEEKTMFIDLDEEFQFDIPCLLYDPCFLYELKKRLSEMCLQDVSLYINDDECLYGLINQNLYIIESEEFKKGIISMERINEEEVYLNGLYEIRFLA